jgi:hypothetical protein
VVVGIAAQMEGRRLLFNLKKDTYIMDRLPSTTIDLLKKLEEMFPDQMVTEEMSDFERGKKAGVIELLRLLLQLKHTGE